MTNNPEATCCLEAKKTHCCRKKKSDLHLVSQACAPLELQYRYAKSKSAMVPQYQYTVPGRVGGGWPQAGNWEAKINVKMSVPFWLDFQDLFFRKIELSLFGVPLPKTLV